MCYNPHMTDTTHEEEAPEILSVAVSEDVTSTDGTPAGLKDDKFPVLMRYVRWEGKPARAVTQEDIPRLIEESQVLGELCHTEHGVYSGANAVAHNQIDHTDPLRFFVANSGEVIINPVIINHTKAPVDSIEACTSFPENPPVKVSRYHKITARFQQLNLDRTLTEPLEVEFSGAEAKVMQHEVAHLNGHSVYDTDRNPEHALGEALLTAE